MLKAHSAKRNPRIIRVEESVAVAEIARVATITIVKTKKSQVTDQFIS
jgi:hypothetical protein